MDVRAMIEQPFHPAQSALSGRLVQHCAPIRRAHVSQLGVLFEYRDDLAFGGRDQVIAKVKQKLSIAETEPSFATAREPVIADELTPGR